LFHGDCAGAGILEAKLTSKLSLPTEHDTQEDSEYVPSKLRSASDEETDWEGKREHPLAYGNTWQDVLDDVVREVLHASTSTRRTKRARLTGKRDETGMTARFAFEPNNASFRVSAVEIPLKLVLNVCWNRSIGLRGALDQDGKLFANESMEHAIEWAARDVRLGLELVQAHGCEDKASGVPAKRGVRT
jgi:hypothetical protein